MRVQIPAKAKFAPNCVRNSLLSCYLFIIAKLFMVKDGCLKFVYIGKNPWFMAFLDSKIHTRLAIVTENELGLVFSPRNLPKKFCPDPSTFFLVIVVTNKQTDRQTNAGDYIIPCESFRGDNYFLTNNLKHIFVKFCFVFHLFSLYLLHLQAQCLLFLLTILYVVMLIG